MCVGIVMSVLILSSTTIVLVVVDIVFECPRQAHKTSYTDRLHTILSFGNAIYDRDVIKNMHQPTNDTQQSAST